MKNDLIIDDWTKIESDYVVWDFKFTHKSGEVRNGKVFLPAGMKPDGKIAAVYGDLFHPDHFGVWDLISRPLTAD